MTHESSDAPTCVLDPVVLNEQSVHNMTDMGLSIFAVLCGENRGAFVLSNSTYSCLNLPEEFAINAGIDVNENFTIAESNDIKTELIAGNITGEQAVNVLSQLNTAVYESSAHVASDPFACNLNGLNMLECANNSDDVKRLVPEFGDKIRSVVLVSALTPAPWDKDWNLDDAGTVFYQQSDLDEIAAAGLNVVVLAVPLSAWHHHSKKKHHLDELDSLLSMVNEANLQVILELVNDTEDEDDEDDTAKLVEKAADYAKSHKHHDVVLAVQVPNIASIAAARESSKKLPLLVPLQLGQLQHLDLSSDPHLFGALQLSHTSSIADIASSTILDDRMKLFYHESVSCMQRAPIEYAACYHNMPVLVSGLTDLSIDNCALTGDNFVDYGQCGRFDETVDSQWWLRHRQSLATRQLFAAEQGLGWTYPAWKLWGDTTPLVVDRPAKLLSLKAVLAAGLVPDLNNGDNIFDSACLNPPETDFTLGDETLAPSPGPPPDCGNGWWNYTIEDCSYWVPPPTDSPVACPVCDCDDEEAPGVFDIVASAKNATVAKMEHAVGVDTAPTVSTTNVTVENMEPLLVQSIRTSPSVFTNHSSPGVSTDMVGAFFAGAVVALVLGAVWRTPRRSVGYERIPENTNNAM